MFTPNLRGSVRRMIARDVHARAVFGEPVVAEFAIVNLRLQSAPTTVRADSSASRGAADELLAENTRIMFSSVTEVEIGDAFDFEGKSYRISAVFRRRSVFGRLDHIECDLEPMP